jgi:hypothetical protein
MRNYHVVLADGTETNIKASTMSIYAEGVLAFLNGDQVIRAYAPGAWTYVEVERMDDK